MRYPWKDNTQIFDLVPKEVIYVQQFGCKQVLKIMATTRTPSFVSDTSISSSLSLVASRTTEVQGHRQEQLMQTLIVENALTFDYPNIWGLGPPWPL